MHIIRTNVGKAMPQAIPQSSPFYIYIGAIIKPFPNVLVYGIVLAPLLFELSGVS
jgi:hypothetical protein